jgi:hypothetical protein
VCHSFFLLWPLILWMPLCKCDGHMVFETLNVLRYFKIKVFWDYSPTFYLIMNLMSAFAHLWFRMLCLLCTCVLVFFHKYSWCVYVHTFVLKNIILSSCWRYFLHAFIPKCYCYEYSFLKGILFHSRFIFITSLLPQKFFLVCPLSKCHHM